MNWQIIMKFKLLKYLQLQQMQHSKDLEPESGILFDPTNFLPIIAGEVQKYHHESNNHTYKLKSKD